MNAIRVISASAGSGKTYRLVDELERAIVAPDNPVRPEAVLGTTFTVKAAAELRERVRARLLERGLVAQAQMLATARIGTVNAVCASLVTEFAFELGLPPETRTLQDDASKAAFERSLASLVSTRAGDDEPGEVASGAASVLFECEDRMPGLDWLNQVRQIVQQARSNRIDASTLRRCAQRSTEALLAYLPDAAPDGTAVDQHLRQQLEAFVGSPPRDATKKTADVLDVCRQALACLRDGRPLSWNEWSKLTLLEAAVASHEACEPVREAARAYGRHPQLRADLTSAITSVFELAAAALEAYQQYKRQWGLIDFVDQERLALELLERPEVREILSARLDLVLVDEFQDTSPLQLELFLALARIAPRSVWVGDQKQAIYGFRGTDPGLMDAAVSALETRAGAEALETLEHSWRSRAELVRLTSDVFASAFEAQGIPESRVRLVPSRFTPDPDSLGSVVEVWTLDAKNNSQEAAALAAAVSRVLSDERVLVRDLVTDAPRRPRPADIAILCRSNDAAVRAAAALEARGIPAILGRSGLNSTLEARVVLAALRLWVDSHDSLAAAELGRLAGLPAEPEVWLSHVLDAAGRPFQALDEVLRVEAARRQQPAAGVLAGFDAAVEAVGARELCLRWGSDTQRLANLDQLRSHAVRYVDLCADERQTPTLAGLVAHLDALPAEKDDEQATPGGQAAVRVSTWHGAKGLEWPITVLYGLDRTREPSAFGVHVVSDRDEFSFEAPLDGRWIRYWPDPFRPRPAGPGKPGNYKGNTTLHDSVRNGAEHQAQETRAASENLRLLYVGWTRARDLLVLASRTGKLFDGVLGTLTGTDGAKLLRQFDAEGKATWAGRRVTARMRATGPDEAVAQDVVPGAGYVARGHRLFPPAMVRPSSLSGSCTLGATERLGAMLSVVGGGDPVALGDACHAFFAADGDDLPDAERVAMARTLLASFSVQGALRAEDLADAGALLRGWIHRCWPEATLRREWPLQGRMADGSELHGFADVVLEVPDGLVLLDHKCLGGTLGEALESARGYGGQIAAYVDVLQRATGRAVVARWLHLPFQGVCVEVV